MSRNLSPDQFRDNHKLRGLPTYKSLRYRLPEHWTNDQALHAHVIDRINRAEEHNPFPEEHPGHEGFLNRLDNLRDSELPDAIQRKDKKALGKSTMDYVRQATESGHESAYMRGHGPE